MIEVTFNGHITIPIEYPSYISGISSLNHGLTICAFLEHFFTNISEISQSEYQHLIPFAFRFIYKESIQSTSFKVEFDETELSWTLIRYTNNIGNIRFSGNIEDKL